MTHDKLTDIRTQKVLGFLMTKGLLFGKDIKPIPKAKIDVNEALWVAKNVEPRVLEVLPAAIIHFPKMFTHTEKLPPTLKQIIEAIKVGQTEYKDFQGIEYKKMKRWAEKELKDGRVKPLSKHRINRTYRLDPEIIMKLKARAAELKMNETAYIEKLILMDAT